MPRRMTQANHTNNDAAQRSSHWDLKILLLLLLGSVVLYHVSTALLGHGRMRDIHLGTALHYAQTQIDLAHTIIVGFNATDSPTIQELPAWQAITGLVFKTLGTWWGWGNVVSLVLFLPCLYPLFQLARMYLGEREAWWALCFFLAEPLIFLESGEASPDSFSLATTIWFAYCLFQLVRKPGFKWLVPATLLGCLAAVFKLPFFMMAGLAAGLGLLLNHGFCVRRILWLSVTGGVSAVAFFAWTHYTDAPQANAVFPFVDLRVGHGTNMMFWYFGDLQYRLKPIILVKGAMRIFTSLLGSYCLFGLVLLGWRSRPQNPVAKSLLLGSVLTTLVFYHLVLHHWHYYMMYAPGVALLVAAGWATLETRFLPSLRLTGLAGFLLILCLGQGLLGMRAFSFDEYTPKMSELIKQNTAPTDKLVVIGGGWGGEELIRTGRKGLSAWDAKIFDRPEDLAKLKALGFNKVVLLSESPFENAIQIVNPGQTGLPRIRYEKFMTPLAASWPTVFQNEDILIKTIP